MSTARNKNTPLKKVWRSKHEEIAWIAVIILLVLLLMAWWRPMVRAFDNLTGANLFGQRTTKLAKAQAKLAAAHTLTPASGTSTTTTTGTTGTGSPGTTGGGNITVNVPPTTVTNPGGNTGGGTTPGDSSGGGSTGGPAPNSLLYAQIMPGQDLNTVVSLAGSAPNSCTNATLPLLGSQQVCTFLNNGTGVAVTLVNGSVTTKVPIGF